MIESVNEVCLRLYFVRFNVLIYVFSNIFWLTLYRKWILKIVKALMRLGSTVIDLLGYPVSVDRY